MAKKKEVSEKTKQEEIPEESKQESNPEELQERKIAYITKKRIDSKTILITTYYVDGKKEEIIKEEKL